MDSDDSASSSSEEKDTETIDHAKLYRLNVST